MTQQENSDHLKFIYDRLIHVYNENKNVDFMHRFKQIIDEVEKQEDSFKAYMKYRAERKKNS